MKNLLASAFCFLIIGLSAGALRADEKSDAVEVATQVMEALGSQQYQNLYDELTSDWFKKASGLSRRAFVANLTISRQSAGKIVDLEVVDVKFSKQLPGVDFRGKIYLVTFFTEYNSGNFYEQIIVIEEVGEFRMSGFNGAPAQ